MRRARPLLAALLLLLALAPAASAHDEGEVRPPRHPGRPRGRRHRPARSRSRHLARHGRAGPARSSCPRRGAGRALTGRRHRARRLPRDAAPDQGRLRLRRRRSPDDFVAVAATRCRPTSRASSSSWPLQTGGRRALRFDMGTVCGPQYVDIQVVQLPATARLRLPRRPELLRRGRRRARPSSAPARPRDVFVLADGLTDDDRTRTGTRRGRSRPTTAPAPATAQRRRADGDHVDAARATHARLRRAGSRR